MAPPARCTWDPGGPIVPTHTALPASPGTVVGAPPLCAGRHLSTRLDASAVVDHLSHQRVSLPHMNTLAGALGQVVVCGARRLCAPIGGVGGRKE